MTRDNGLDPVAAPRRIRKTKLLRKTRSCHKTVAWAAIRLMLAILTGTTTEDRHSNEDLHGL